MWTRCAQGHTHWGRRGAAGLLVRHRGPDQVDRYLLQHRAPVVHHGDTWGVPGGAIEPGETARAAAWREAQEELDGLSPDALTLAGTHVDDHGGWSYSTIVMDAVEMFPVSGINFETGPGGCRWMTAREAEQVPMHPGLASSWSRVRQL